MDLSLTDTEVLLRDSVRRFVQQEAGRSLLVELPDQGLTWRPQWLPTMADTGWLGLAVPLDCGGGGASAMELAVVYEELGRGPVPGPMVASSLVAALVLTALAAGPTRETLLTGIAEGSHIVIPALREPASSWRGVGAAAAELPDGQSRLSCAKLFVPYADAATHFLVSLRPDEQERTRFAVVPADRAGVRYRKLSGFLHANFEVVFEDVSIDPATELLVGPAPAVLDDTLAPGLIALAAYQAGGASSVLEMSIDYANNRVQFGKPIGSFQRVQDHVVRILNAADSARWAAYEAAWALDTGQAGAVGRAHLAAAIAGEAYWEAANAGHEVHAGIGSDPKFGLTLYTELSRSLYELLGTPHWHRLRTADALAW
jgi:alkylation response protein AidB-like acyl-CoA dehydrogenase